MTISVEFIDQIVQNVMREMQTRVPMTAAHAPVVSRTTTDVIPAATSALQIAAKVISEDTLIAAQAAGRTISLQPGAIVTPSGRDFIRKNNVRLTSLVGGKNSAASGTFIVVGSNAGAIPAATTAGWATTAAATEVAAASAALEYMSKGHVTCFGGEPSIVACLLNRNQSVRAAVITKATNLLTLTTVMSPQVLCMDSSGWSFGDILKLLRSLSAANQPKGWREI